MNNLAKVTHSKPDKKHALNSCCCFIYRKQTDKDYSYVVYTRLYNVPAEYDGKMLCHRLEQEYKVGPLELNREAVLRTYTDLKNEKTIFTDNNGYQVLKRQYKAYMNNTVARVSTKKIH